MTETLKWLSTDPDINPILFQSSQSPEWCDSGRKAGFLSRYLLYGETETSVLWPPDAKSQLIGKDPDSGKDWRQNEKRATEDEIVGWHHWLNGHEFEQVPGDGEEQGSLACCSPWGHKELDMTERLNKNKRVNKKFLISKVYNVSFYLWSFLKLISNESGMPSNHLILCHPLLLVGSW